MKRVEAEAIYGAEMVKLTGSGPSRHAGPFAAVHATSAIRMELKEVS